MKSFSAVRSAADNLKTIGSPVDQDLQSLQDNWFIIYEYNAVSSHNVFPFLYI